nr:zinc finger protein 200 isoform X2 [Manis javanica]
MAAKVVPMRLKSKRSFILRVPPDSRLSQDLHRDATSGPKTIHQLVLEHFLTFLPKSSLNQPNKKVRETLVIMKDVSANFRNRGLLDQEELEGSALHSCLRTRTPKHKEETARWWDLLDSARPDRVKWRPSRDLKEREKVRATTSRRESPGQGN